MFELLIFHWRRYFEGFFGGGQQGAIYLIPIPLNTQILIFKLVFKPNLIGSLAQSMSGGHEFIDTSWLFKNFFLFLIVFVDVTQPLKVLFIFVFFDLDGVQFGVFHKFL